jgi:hypothetical protein
MTGDTGAIRNPARAFQHIDFTGIRYGNATPSNVDGILELGGKLFVLLEYKHVSAQAMPKGQRLLIERTVDALESKARSIAIVGEHGTPVGQVIDGANTPAIEIRWAGEWRDMEGRGFTVKDCVDRAYQYAFNSPF